MLKQVLKVSISAFLIMIFALYVKAGEHKLLQAGVEMTVPAGFYGTWRVESTLVATNAPANFKKSNVDIWNLSGHDGVFNLTNPFSGAKASVTLDLAEGNKIRFTKSGNYDSRVLTDSVELILEGDSFIGENTLTLDTLSDIDKSIIKTATAKYTLKGEKLYEYKGE